MKTYWFTIADGDIYQLHATRLKRSLEVHGVTLTILAPGPANSREAKHRKISGILEAPRSCERIVYLDADTFVLDPAGIEAVNGAWQIPWRIEVEGCLPKKLDPRVSAERLESFYVRHGLSMFAKGGSLEGVEWNSGVIVGERDLMIELAQEWSLWWDRILELFDGHFRRDQLSFRIAYHSVCLAKKVAGLPASYNWIVSYFGINPNVNILHRTMVRKWQWVEEAWERIVARKLAGEEVRTANHSFEYAGIAKERPCLQRNTDVDLAREVDLLRQTLAFCKPQQVLLCGVTQDDRRFLSQVIEYTGRYVCIDSLHSLPAELDPVTFDLVLFCGVDYTLPATRTCQFHPEAIFCFAGIHDMALYEYLHDFRYVRLLDQGFGLFSHSPSITTWSYAGAEQKLDIRRESS